MKRGNFPTSAHRPVQGAKHTSERNRTRLKQLQQAAQARNNTALEWQPAQFRQHLELAEWLRIADDEPAFAAGEDEVTENLSLLDDDELSPDDDDTLEPADLLDNQGVDLLALPEVAKSPAVLDLTNVYWVAIQRGDNAYSCQFRCPAWLQPSRQDPFAIAKRTLIAFMENLADWLEQHAQTFLDAPSVPTFASSQGDTYAHFCRDPIVTQDGLAKRIARDGHALKKEAVSRLLKDEKIWLVWKDGGCAPINVLFSDEFRLAWAQAALDAWRSEHPHAKVEWHQVEGAAEAAVKGQNPANDFASDALRRISSLAGLAQQYVGKSFIEPK